MMRYICVPPGIQQEDGVLRDPNEIVDLLENGEDCFEVNPFIISMDKYEHFAEVIGRQYDILLARNPKVKELPLILELIKYLVIHSPISDELQLELLEKLTDVNFIEKKVLIAIPLFDNIIGECERGKDIRNCGFYLFLTDLILECVKLMMSKFTGKDFTHWPGDFTGE